MGIYRAEFGGGYTTRRKVIVDAADMAPFGGEGYEIMALYENGEELDCRKAYGYAKAKETFNELVQKYAEPFQRAVYGAHLVRGNAYTFVYIDDFGFPVTMKCTLHGYEATTYAQHSNAVKFTVKERRKKRQCKRLFYNQSLLIFSGWHDLPDDVLWKTVKRGNGVTVRRSSYGSFDEHFIDDALAHMGGAGHGLSFPNQGGHCPESRNYGMNRENSKCIARPPPGIAL